MIFKRYWEKKSSSYDLPNNIINQMVQLAFPDKALISKELISGGCANLNVKILVKDEKPYILRVYLRDNEAAFREKLISELLSATVPVPKTYYIDKINEHYFAITEFMPGIPLCDLLLGDATFNLGSVMKDVGTVLSHITAIQFSNSGFFNIKLEVLPQDYLNDYLTYAKNCLENKKILNLLETTMIDKIHIYLDKHAHLFPTHDEKNLVHADFDPANILVQQIQNEWKISAVLDWEFAYSGSVLIDISNMLRYAHKMPSEFQSKFLEGLTTHGIVLPKDWEISIRLLNLVSLIDILVRTDPIKSPLQCKDIKELINYILSTS